MQRYESYSPLGQAVLIGALLVGAVLVLAAVAEGTVRVRHWLKFGDLWGIESTYTVDAETGLRIPVPGSAFGPIRINSLGFRSPEVAGAKSAATLRLAFLGESTTYCAEVSSNEMTWPHLVWQSLSARWPDARIDYINAAVPGYGAIASLRNLEGRVAALDPDVIIIYQGFNDLAFHTYEAAVEQGLAVGRTEEELTWPARHSLLWYLAEKNLRILVQQRRVQDVSAKLVVDVERLTRPYEANLLRLVEASQKVADLVVVATLSPRLRAGQTIAQQTDAVATSLYYMPYMSIEGLLVMYAAYNDAIRRVAATTGAVLVGDEDYVPGDAEHFVDSVHFSDAGSTRMAERVELSLLQSERTRDLLEAAARRSRLVGEAER